MSCVTVGRLQDYEIIPLSVKRGRKQSFWHTTVVKVVEMMPVRL